MNHPFETSIVFAEHEGSSRTKLTHLPVDFSDPHALSQDGWQIELKPGTLPAAYRLGVERTGACVKNRAFGISILDTEWATENFVLIPGAVYAGNRFHAQAYNYSPPPAGPDPASDERVPRIGDLPRLSLEPGTSHLDQMSCDAATPALAVYFPQRGKALCLLTTHRHALGYYGYEIIENEDRSEAELLLMLPGLRHDKLFSISGGYRIDSDQRAADFATGARAELDFRLHWFDCGSVQELFDFVFAHRYDCEPLAPARDEISFSATWDILHEKHNRENWREHERLYQVSINQDPPNPFMLFQTGWVGGMITTLAMLQEGDAQSVERALENMETFFAGAQSDYGLFHEYLHDGRWFSNLRITYDEYGHGDHQFDPDEPWTLVRRLGDALFFLSRQFLLLQEQDMSARIRPKWQTQLKKNALALIDIWKRHGEFGQYVDVETGDVKVAGSTAAALVPAALIVAAEYFKEPGWIAVAAEIADYLERDHLRAGVTTGAPGDCVQAPDSESVAALIESFILLYEATGESRWLAAAEDSVVQTASWALSYDFEFPEESALAEINAQSRGVFIANAQNKCGVPGICTLSGQSIFRVYRATGNEAYLKFMTEIAHAIPQFMGRTDKRIPTRLSWGRPGVTHLPQGWICERVNITQWGEPTGEIAAYSCWCETAMMLTWCDLPGVYVRPDTGFVWTCDHVDAAWIEAERTLRIHNPTQYPARVRLLAEREDERARPLPVNVAARWATHFIPAGGEVVLHFD